MEMKRSDSNLSNDTKYSLTSVTKCSWKSFQTVQFANCCQSYIKTSNFDDVMASFIGPRILKLTSMELILHMLVVPIANYAYASFHRIWAIYDFTRKLYSCDATNNSSSYHRRKENRVIYKSTVGQIHDLSIHLGAPNDFLSNGGIFMQIGCVLAILWRFFWLVAL